jgi:hypothetical protein
MMAASVKNGASTIAYGLVKYYRGNETGQVPGILPEPYYCLLPLPSNSRISRTSISKVIAG